jgi:hypothetical protein
MPFIRILSTISILLLAGCSDSKTADSKQSPGKDHIFQGQARALEKAKGVEQTVQDAAEQQRRAMDREDQ